VAAPAFDYSSPRFKFGRAAVETTAVQPLTIRARLQKLVVVFHYRT